MRQFYFNSLHAGKFCVCFICHLQKKNSNLTFSKKKYFWNTIRLQTVKTQIMPDIWSGLIWVQTVCKDYQQTTLASKELAQCFSRIFANRRPLLKESWKLGGRRCLSQHRERWSIQWMSLMKRWITFISYSLRGVSNTQVGLHFSFLLPFSMLGNFSCFCYQLLNFFKMIFLFSKNYFRNNISVKQFGSRSGPTFCPSWSGSKLFA